jgi:hypothetical protein
MDDEIFKSVERITLLSLSLAERLEECGMPILSRVARALYLDASQSMERMEEAMGIDAVPTTPTFVDRRRSVPALPPNTKWLRARAHQNRATDAAQKQA